MKHLSALLFLTVFLQAALSAQATFSLTPNPASVIAPAEEFDAACHAVIKNISTQVDSIRWTRTEVELPEGFYTAVCDCIQCYFPGVSTQTFTIQPNATCPLDVHFYNPNMTSGSGVVHLKVVNLKVPNDMVTGVYLYNTSTSTQDPLPAAEVRLFPNPVVDGFTLERADEVAGVHLFSLTGGRVAYFQPSANQRYSIADQPAGHYIVVLEARNGKYFQAIEINKQ